MVEAYKQTICAEDADREQLLLSRQMAERVGQGFTVPDIYSTVSGSLGENNIESI